MSNLLALWLFWVYCMYTVYTLPSITVCVHTTIVRFCCPQTTQFCNSVVIQIRSEILHTVKCDIASANLSADVRCVVPLSQLSLLLHVLGGCVSVCTCQSSSHNEHNWWSRTLKWECLPHSFLIRMIFILGSHTVHTSSHTNLLCEREHKSRGPLATGVAHSKEWVSGCLTSLTL